MEALEIVALAVVSIATLGLGAIWTATVVHWLLDHPPHPLAEPGERLAPDAKGSTGGIRVLR